MEPTLLVELIKAAALLIGSAAGLLTAVQALRAQKPKEERGPIDRQLAKIGLKPGWASSLISKNGKN